MRSLDAKFFHVNGVQLAVHISGDGTMPLVLLHGGGLDRTTWDTVAPAFAATHTVYALDQRGFGLTERTGQYSYELMRDDVLGLADVIGADRFDLIGHSMGGTVAWLVAEQSPERVAHLVIEDSPPPKPGLSPMPLRERPEGELPFDYAAWAAIIGQFNDPDPQWWYGIAKVTAPTLMLAGGAGSHVPQELFAQALAMLPQGQLVEIPVGHHIHAAAPEAFLAQVIPFLSG
jgi:pimeloyl-ACP methyl ester carboxylesterase